MYASAIIIDLSATRDVGSVYDTIFVMTAVALPDIRAVIFVLK